MKKIMSKIAKGTKKDEGVSWFPDLADKGKKLPIIKLHCS